MTDMIDFDYEADFEATDKQGGGGIIPHGYYRLWAESIEFPETKDGKGRQAAITFEVQEPAEFKSKKLWAYWTILHSEGWNFGGYKYGKPMFDRFQRAIQTVVEKGMKKEELLYKTFVAEVGIQAGGIKTPATTTTPAEYYKDKNQIEHFYYEDDNAKEPVPELGVIGDDTQPAKAAPKAANDNAPAQPAKVAAGGGKRPW